MFSIEVGAVRPRHRGSACVCLRCGPGDISAFASREESLQLFRALIITADLRFANPNFIHGRSGVHALLNRKTSSCPHSKAKLALRLLTKATTPIMWNWLEESAGNM